MNMIKSQIGVGSPKSSLVDQFREFKTNFTGNPQAAIDNLVQSGRVTNSQVEQAKLLAYMVKNATKMK